MHGKELILASLAHEPLPELPRDIFEGWMWPGITAEIIKRLNAHDFNDMLDKLGVGFRWVTPYYCGPKKLPAGAKSRIASRHSTHSLNSAIWKLSSDELHPLSKAETEADINNYDWPSPKWFDYYYISWLSRKYKNHFVVAGGFSPLFYLISDLFGMEKALTDMIVKPELIHAAVNKIKTFYKGYFHRIARIYCENIDAIAFGDDFASQASMLFNPALWREFFKPVWSELFGMAKEYGYKVMFHSCGSVAEVIPDLIEAGLDVLYPVQPKATGMDLLSLKIKYGKALSFYGGVDVQHLLPYGGPDEIKEEAKRLYDLFKNDGGYILSTSHVVMEDVPPENFFALYQIGRNENNAG